MAYKRCGCADAVSGKQLGGRCVRLAEAWHGSWYFAVQVSGLAGRRGGFATAEQARQAGREVIAADRNDVAVGGYTLARWLRRWLDMQPHLRPSTREAYADHVRLYLIPYLGRIELAELASCDIARMFAVLARRRNRYGQLIASSTLPRIRATLRTALNAAVREGLLASNPARMIRLPAPRQPYPEVWTERRVAAWRRSGERPAVAVWTAEQLAEFLAFARGDPLYPLWQLIALRGLRRGEAAGLRWVDLDLDRRELTVSRQLVHTDDGLIACPPKTAASRRIVALDPETVRLLRRHEQAQRQLLGDAWNESGPIFARTDGSPVRPDYLTVRFHQLVQASNLPPIRLHDLRHGTATLALASGSDLRVVQGTLGHGSIVVTSDIYTSVLPEVYHRSAQAIVRLVLGKARRTARNLRKAAA
ncbi:tyrosine-type recombinase/integrase [Nonomuraea sp. NPDC003804]|uniref:site-specific integrase n=1 Tax=Nonomuraea sp. NPDC003804 TaxID=3154547 RepID=UPI0033A9CC13